MLHGEGTESSTMHCSFYKSVPCSLSWGIIETQERQAQMVAWGTKYSEQDRERDACDARLTKRQKNLLLVMSN